MIRGDPEDLKELERIRRKLDGIRGGPGILVRNTRDGITISGPPGRPVAGGHDDGQRWARVTASTRPGAAWQWSYTLELVEKTAAGYGGWSTVSGVDTVTGYNLLENANGSTGLMGCGVNIDNLPTGFELQPAPVGTVVRVWIVPVLDADAEHWFAHENAVDGTCGGA